MKTDLEKSTNNQHLLAWLRTTNGAAMALLGLLLLLAPATEATAAAYHWAGGSDSNWLNAANWTAAGPMPYNGVTTNRLEVQSWGANDCYFNFPGSAVTNSVNGSVRGLLLYSGNLHISGGSFASLGLSGGWARFGAELVGDAAGSAAAIVDGGNFSCLNLTLGYATTTNVSLLLSNGTANIAVLYIGGGVANSYNLVGLDGGTLTVGTNIFYVSNGSNIFQFNGGTLIPLGNNTNTFLPAAANSAAIVSAGGAFINDGGNVISIGAALVPDPNSTGGGLTKQGRGILILTNANTYTGNTIISAGTLALGANGSLNGASNIRIAAGSTFDLSAHASPYNWGGGGMITASGTGTIIGTTAASINGANGGVINLGSQGIILNYDGLDPALFISQGTLALNGNAFTINGSLLGVGTNILVSAASGNITSTGSFPVPTGTAIPGSGYTKTISVSGGNVVLTIAASVLPTPVFSNLTPSQSITCGITGTASISLGGTVSAPGPIYPAYGETVSVTIDGITQYAPIKDSTGDFSLSFSTTAIPASVTPYTIRYSYTGNHTTLLAALDTSTTLTMNQGTPTIVTVPTASVIPWGQALSASKLSGGLATVGGTFVFTTPALVPPEGTALQSVIFAPTDATDYSAVILYVSVTVGPGGGPAQTFSWWGTGDTNFLNSANWDGVGIMATNLITNNRFNVESGNGDDCYYNFPGITTILAADGNERGLVLGSTRTGGATAQGRLHVSGGTLASQAGIADVDILGSVCPAGSTNALIVDGGNFSSYNLDIGFNGIGCYNFLIMSSGTATIGNLIMPPVGSTPCTNWVSLDGGTLTLGSFAVGGAYPAFFYFNGGTLMAGTNIASSTPPATNFIPASTYLTAIVSIGGAVIDDGGYAITISQPLVHDSTLGSFTDGGLTKLDAGTLTLTGANTYTGPTTISAGTLDVANPLGLQSSTLTMSGGGVLVFDQGGTNAYTAFTLGGLASSASGPGYNLALQNNAATPAAVTLTVGNNNANTAYAGSLSDSGLSSSLTKIGAGTLTLSGVNTYSGPTLISGGELAGKVGGSIASAVTVSNTASCVIGVLITDNTKQWTCPSLTFAGSGAGLDFNFGYVNSTTPSTSVAPLQVNGPVAFAGTPTVTIEAGNLAVGTYPLMAWTGAVSGTAPTTVILPPHVSGNLSIVGNLLQLNVTGSSPEPLFWNAGTGVWDINTTPNWRDASGVQYYLQSDAGDNVVFDDSGTGGTVTLNTNVNPISVTVTNATRNYTISGTGSITGFTGLSKAGAGTLTLATTNTYTGPTIINNGALNVGSEEIVGVGGPLGQSWAANAGSIVFGGGTLQYSAANQNDYSGRFSQATGQPVSIDTAGQNVRFTTALTSAGGTLTKLGTGTLTLAGVNTYAGGTVVNGGTLAVTLPMASSSLILASGTALTIATANGTWAPASMVLTNATLNFNFGNFNGNTSGALNVANLVINSTITVNISGSSFAATNITLLTYGSETGGGAFVLGTLPTGTMATLVDTGSSVVLEITSTLQALVWSESVDNNWQTNGTADWNNGTAVYVEFANVGYGDSVVFDDTVGNGYGGTVNLPGVVRPLLITVNDINSYYTFSGPGGISGPAGIAKTGSSTLQISTSNNFTGGVTISGSTGGYVFVDNPMALGATGGSNSVTGPTGTLEIGTPGGTGVTVTGDTIAIAGTGVGGALGALRGATTVNGMNVWAGPVIITASGTRIGTEQDGNLTVSGNITDNGKNYLLVIRPGSQSTVTISGTNNTYGSTSLYSDAAAPGTVLLGANNALSTGVLNVGPNPLDLSGFNQTFSGITEPYAGASIINNGTNASTLTISNNVANYTLAGTSLLDGASPLGVTKTGAGTLTLAGVNTYNYSGPTTVNGGELLINSSLGNTAVTVNSNGLLSGNATFVGPVTLNSGGSLAPGSGGIGTFTNNSTLTLNAGSTNFFEIDASTTNSDLVVATTVTYGGQLVVRNLGGIRNQVGEVYQLFNVGSYSGNFVNATSVTISDGTIGSFDPTTGFLTITSAPPLASTNAYLTSLVLNPTGLTSTFASNVLSYLATNAYGSQPTVTVTNADLTASNELIYNGSSIGVLTSGVPSLALSLNANPAVTNVVSVQVTAQDGVTVMTYTANLIQLPSQAKPTLTNTASGGKLQLNWPLANLGYRLLVQTNNLNLGVSGNLADWGTVAGSTATNTASISIIRTNNNAYYRLAYP